MFQRIVHIWKFLWKSREDKKAELARRGIEAFEALAVIDLATKQKMRPYVKDLYNDLMEIEVLRFKVNFIAGPLVILFSIIAWLLVTEYIIHILDSLLQFFFSIGLSVVF